MANYAGVYETLCMLQGSVKYTSIETGQTGWKIGNLELAKTSTGNVVCLVNFNIGGSKKFMVTNQINGVIFNLNTPRCNISLANGANISWTTKVGGKTIHVNPPANVTRFANLLNELQNERKKDKRPNTSAQLSFMSPRPTAYTPPKQSPRLGNSQVNHRAPPTSPRASNAITPLKTGRTSPTFMMTPSHIKAARGLVKTESNQCHQSQGEESEGNNEADLSGMLFMDVQDDTDKENNNINSYRTSKMGSVTRSKSVCQMRKEEGGSLFLESFQEKQLRLEERKENTAPKPVSGVTSFYSRGRQAAGYSATDALLQSRQTNTNTTSAVKRTPGFLSLPQPKKPCQGNRYIGWSQRNTLTTTKTSQLSLQGFSNLGNTCYMNAILQSLFALDRFTMDILNGSLLPHMQKESLYKALASLLFAKQRNQSPDRVGTQLRRVKQAISSTAARFSGFMQHDAQEFLCQCLDQLKDDWKKAKLRLGDTPPPDSPRTDGDKDPGDPHPCPVVKNFEFEVMHSIACKQCGEVVTKAEQFYDLSLDMPRRSSSNPIGTIQTALEQFFRAEVIEYACSECNCKQATVTHTFTRLPRVIIIHLKRYRFDVDVAQNAKLRRRILIPKYLSLHHHCTKATQSPTSWRASLINGNQSPQRPLNEDRTLRPVIGLADGNSSATSQSGKPSRFNFSTSSSRKQLEYSSSNSSNQPRQTIFLDSAPDSDETQQALEMSKREAKEAKQELERRRKQEEEELKKAMEQSKQDADRPITDMSEEQQLAYALALSAHDMSTLQSRNSLQISDTTHSLLEDVPDIPQQFRSQPRLLEKTEKDSVSLKKREIGDVFQSLDNGLVKGVSEDCFDMDLYQNGTPCKRFKGERLPSHQSTPSELAQCAEDSEIDLTDDTQGVEGNRTKPRPWHKAKKSIINFFSPLKKALENKSSGLDNDLTTTPLSTISQPNLIEAAVVDITREDHSTFHIGENNEAKPSYAELQAREDEELRRATELSLQDAEEIVKKEEDALKQAKQMSLQEFSESFNFLEDEEETSEPMVIEDEVEEDEETQELAKNAESGHLPSSYRLASIVSHIGSTSSVGHYISDVYDSKKSSWLSYDDSQVVRMTESAVREERERTGYIFFYIAK